MQAKQEVYTFCELSSIRGLSRAVKATSRGSRLIWTAAVIIGSIVTIWYLTQICKEYYSYSSVTAFENKRDKNEFPAVTVCNLQPISSRADHSMLHEKEDEYREQFDNITGGYLPNNEWLPSFIDKTNYFASIRAFFQNLNRETLTEFGHSVEDLVVLCQWEEDLNGSVRACEPSDYTSHFHPDYLACYKFFNYKQNLVSHSASTATNFDVISLRFTFFIDDFFDHVFEWMGVTTGNEPNSGIILFIHENDTLPHFEQGIRVSAGYSATLDLATVKYHTLEEPYRDCTTEEYITFNGRKTAFRQNLGICTKFCYQKALIEELGCILPDYPFDENMRNSYPFCGNLSVKANIGNIDKWWTICDRDGPKCIENCKEPCKSISYKVMVKNSKWPHISYHTQFYKNVITKKMRQDIVEQFLVYKTISEMTDSNMSEATRLLHQTDLISRNFVEVSVRMTSLLETLIKDHPALSADVFFSAVGGLLNLWIGLSFVTVFELMDLIFNLIKSKLCRQPARQQ